MQAFIDYIVQCIRPADTTEFNIIPVFDMNEYNSLKQDGILVCHTKSEIDPAIDHIIINDYMICRKNSPLQIEWLKSNGSIEFSSSSAPLYRRLLPGAYETVNHVHIIKSILLATNSANKTYIEYGVRSGTSIGPISQIVKQAYGVDITPYTPTNSNIHMNVMLTDEFSEKMLPSITYDYAFIDADHSSFQVLKDFDSIYKYIQPGGYIFLHDTYPCLELLLAPMYCNDCYRSPLLIREKYPTIKMLTLPLNPGITIICK
jgi:hypothetical protein